jgi:hypothetical protein
MAVDARARTLAWFAHHLDDPSHGSGTARRRDRETGPALAGRRDRSRESPVRRRPERSLDTAP